MLDSRLENDSEFICDLEAGQLRMIKDGDNDWFLIIPLVEGCYELIDLPMEHQITLLKDINLVSRLLKKYSAPDKLNIGALGNMVKQLHIHIIARYEADRAWPHAIWGTDSKKAFDSKQITLWRERFSSDITHS